MFADADALARAPRDEIVELLARTAELARIVDAQRVRLAGAIAERSSGPAEEALCRRLGQRSAKETVASAFGLRAGEAQALLALAAATSAAIGLTGGDIAVKYPRVAAALDDGDISLGQARAIVQHLEPAAPRADLDQLGWAEDQLVTAATDPDWPLGPELLITQARAYVAVLDPDGVLPNAERQRAMRSLRLRRRADGMWLLEMLCTPESGSAIKTLLDAYTSPRVTVAFRDDGVDDTGGDAGDGRHPDANGQPEAEDLGIVDDRTPEQKRHDVLLALVQAHAASGEAPVAGGEPPTLLFTGTIEAYDAYLHGLEHPDRSLTVQHTGSLVPVETIDRLLCHAFVQKVVLDEHGHPLQLGRAERLFSRAQKRALAARDGGCATPDCGMPVAWTEAHHVQPWEHGGRTDVDNGILLCSHCHHEVHAGRLRILHASDRPGHWRVVPELRPADRYARAGRTGPSLASATVSSRVGGPTGTLAAAAGTTLAVTLPDRHPSLPDPYHRLSDPHHRLSDPRPTPAVRPPRRRARGVEARLQHRVRARREPARRMASIDLLPMPRIVLRR
nr:HNH endonuclease signature motif containing protein [Agrococcus sp. ARC_14]